MTDLSKRFVRWQTVTREHFTATTNLVLGLSTGLIAFLTNGLVEDKYSSLWAFALAVLASTALVASISLGLWCAINRLKDFRGTAKTVRDLTEQKSPSGSRYETRILGDRSWCLFRWQLILFGIGALTSTIAFLIRIWPSA